MRSESGKRFLAVMASITFVVIVIGATFAYFTAKAQSDENAVNTASHFVQVDYTEGSKSMQAIDLIPASEEVALFSYHGMKYNDDNEVVYTDNDQCVDDNKRTICSIYSFEVTNLGDIDQHLGAFITITSNEFKNLKYVLYNVTDVTDEDTVLEKYNHKVKISTGNLANTYTDAGTFTGNGLEYVIGAKDQVEQILKPNVTQKYELVIWLNETGDVQDEQLNKFSGTMTVSLTDKQHVYGYIEKANKN